MYITKYNEKTFVNGIKAEGLAEGLAEGEIKGRIITLLEFGKTPKECIADMITRFDLTKEEAMDYFNKYGTELV